LTTLLDYAIPGVPFGCVFALMAVGLVLTYKASGVFNLAFGAQAFVSSLAFVSFVADGWPRWLAGLVAIVVLGPALGLVLDRVLFRRVRTASPLVKLVPALGLLIALPQVALIVAGSAPDIAPPSLFFDAQRVYLHVASVPISGLELSVTVATVAVVIALVAVFRFTPIGLEMRAVVESPRMTELAGVNAGLVSAFAWVLSSCLAGLAGVLLAPLYAQLDSQNYTVLLVWGIAAAVVARFASLPVALLGGIGLGIGQQVLAGYLPAGILATGLRPSLPFFVLLAFLPFARQRQVDDPLAGCDPPPTALVGEATGYRSANLLAPSGGDGAGHAVAGWHRALQARADRGAGVPSAGAHGVVDRLASRPTLVVAWAVGGLAVLSALTWVPNVWLVTMTQGIAFAVIFVSLTLLTGMSGQISLCQASFAGLGGFVAGQLADHFGTSVLVGMVLGGAVAAVLGVVVALPTLRLAGLPLALATLAFALLADNILFPNSWVGNGATGVTVPRPQLGPIGFNGSRSFFVLALVVLALVAALVRTVGQGRMGRLLAAMRGSELASVSTGIDVHRLRVVAFALSAGLAGVGGALYGSLERSLSPDAFNYQLSLVFLVVAAIVGLGSVSGAVVAGLVFTALQTEVATFPPRFSGLLPVVFGLATLSYTRHPEGIVDFLGGGVLRALGRRRQGAAGAGGGDGPGAGPGPADRSSARTAARSAVATGEVAVPEGGGRS
jgi:branched-subunit amino acid ABC-type transport system permease component